MRLTRIAAIALLAIVLVATVACSSTQDTYCSSGCKTSQLGDGVCQNACNNAACYYDNGDCSIQLATPPPSTPVSCDIRYEVTGSISGIVFTEKASTIEYTDGDGNLVWLYNVDLPWTYSTTMEYVPNTSIYPVLDTKVTLSASASSSDRIAVTGHIEVKIYKDGFLCGHDVDSNDYSIHASAEVSLESTFCY